MKILLFGEYSNVHWTLAEGLRALGHQVVVVSDGDGWKNYRRDIDLQRSSLSLPSSFSYLWQVWHTVRSLKDFDIVQIINPIFLDLRAKHILPFYKRLRKQNGRLFMGAFGMDHYWVKAGLDCKTFRYSDFNLGATIRKSKDNDSLVNEWMKGEKEMLNKYIAADCDGIVSGLYEYDMSYRPYYADKLCFIPFPINTDETASKPTYPSGDKVRFFIGIQRKRNEYKGTDIMLKALERVKKEYPDFCDIVRVENIHFDEYQQRMEKSDVLLDQLYSYTPAMNALLAMAKGIVVVGGGEAENYEILGEEDLRPIINVEPNEESVYTALRQIVLHRERLPQLQKESIEYIRKHHDYRKVAQQYLDFWTKKSENHPPVR